MERPLTRLSKKTTIGVAVACFLPTPSPKVIHTHRDDHVAAGRGSNFKARYDVSQAATMRQQVYPWEATQLPFACVSTPTKLPSAVTKLQQWDCGLQKARYLAGMGLGKLNADLCPFSRLLGSRKCREVCKGRRTMSLSSRLPAIRIFASISSNPCESLTLACLSTTSSMLAYFLPACQHYVIVCSSQSTLYGYRVFPRTVTASRQGWRDWHDG
ncbi:uncharacterized protein HD556DRAFT_623194 [Suillus plorans]|uniref:Uncharacterized protein n=1 Tax=Suillus plorans TaxID=116603 RepID=A0A9P7AML9_9AGAM|nr:uncharacterized protein HD556DRAFT_623194 [Suillus plorans]KAG1791841.1 hypothetical protein HD556DRAFT_623194 [Suillus plorans]